MRSALWLLILVCSFVRPGHAQGRAPEAPDWLRGVGEEVRLGVGFEAGLFHSRLSIAPIENRNLRYLSRPVASELSPVTTPVYGANAGLRWKETVAIAVAFRLNSGMAPYANLRFQSGARAIPSMYTVRQWEVRAEFFFQENVGGGLLYRNEREGLERVSSFTIAGHDITANIFFASSERQSLSLYVPLRAEMGGATGLFGRIGLSVVGRSDESYSTGFTRYQDPDRPDEIFPVPPTNDSPFIDLDAISLGRQFARLGIRHRRYGMTWRLALHGERISVDDVSKEFRGGARFEVGLPF